MALKNTLLMFWAMNNFPIKLNGLSPQASYADRATVACQRS
jgi:hypothetical protein